MKLPDGTFTEPHHNWGEEDFDWKGLNDAAEIIYRICTKYGRFGGSIKEKYGTLRFYCFFSDGTIHSLVKPGHYYIRFPKWFYWGFDEPIFRKVMHYTGALKLLHVYQHWIYNLAYQRAIAKYPHLIEEILVDADWPEYILGGEEVHNKYWKKIDFKEEP